MKQLTCEMCGSTELIKQDGVFVCQYCGCKYSVEEAKSLMIEGTVDVQGTVKVDNSAFVEKYLANARRAKEKEDWEETEKYYNMVEQNDPTNIEAIFYSSYGKAKSTLVDGDLYKRQAAFKVLQNCVSILDDNFNMEKEEEQRNIIDQISTDILSMCLSTYVYNQKKNGYGIVTWTDKNETVQLFINLNSEFCTTLDEIVKKYPEDDSRIPFFLEKAIFHKNIMLTLGLQNPSYTRNAIQKYHEQWHKIDPSHDIPSPAPSEPQKSGGCYVATAVYGSYDCPEVWTLRRYRDTTLASTWYGRAFIHTYYAISPTLVKWFGHTEWFKKMWKGKLNRLVKDLQESGVEGTPYEDKEW